MTRRSQQCDNLCTEHSKQRLKESSAKLCRVFKARVRILTLIQMMLVAIGGCKTRDWQYLTYIIERSLWLLCAEWIVEIKRKQGVSLRSPLQ